MLSDTVTAPLNVGVPLNVPLNAAPLIVGVVNVLFVNVWVLVNWTISLFVIEAILVAVAAFPVVSWLPVHLHLVN